MSEVRPISPDMVAQQLSRQIPSAVIETFNALIAANWDGASSTFRHDVAVERIADRMDVAKEDRGNIRRLGWLAIEPVYEARGWDVMLDDGVYQFTAKETET